MKTLLLQRSFLFGITEQLATLEDLPIVRRSSKKSSADAKAPRSPTTKNKSPKRRPAARTKAQTGLAEPYATSSDDQGTSDTNSELDIAGQESISLVDAVLNQILDSSIQNILFEPTVRISYTYETKIPNYIRKMYTSEKLIETALGPTASPVSPRVVPIDDVKRSARSRSGSTFGDGSYLQWMYCISPHPSFVR
jgi:hypothetical protein